MRNRVTLYVDGDVRMLLADGSKVVTSEVSLENDDLGDHLIVATSALVAWFGGDWKSRLYKPKCFGSPNLPVVVVETPPDMPGYKRFFIVDGVLIPASSTEEHNRAWEIYEAHRASKQKNVVFQSPMDAITHMLYESCLGPSEDVVSEPEPS